MKFRGILFTAIGLLFAAQVSAQDVQDTFMGMKLGTVLNETSINRGVGDRGSYLSASNKSSHSVVSFKDIYFGGDKWNYGYFYLNPNKFFYQFEVSNYYSLSSEAMSKFDGMKSRLNKKYTPEVLSDDINSKAIAYYGDNGIDVLLSYEYSQSNGGTYYYYVNLSYIHELLYFAVEDAEDDEL